MTSGRRTILDLVITIIIPLVILTRLSGVLGARGALLAAVALPAGWGVWDLERQRRVNIYAIIGVISILLTGGIGLLQLNPRWLAVKEAAVPLALGIAVIASHPTRWSLARGLFETMLNTETIAALGGLEERKLYERRLVRATYLFAASFFLSAGLNFMLARTIVHSDPGTHAFNAELGRLTALSYPVIVVPSLMLLIAAAAYYLTGVSAIISRPVEKLIKRL